jgi:ribonucleoside-diphosphate reductase alpha chain
MNENIFKLLQDRYFLPGEDSWNQIASRVGSIYAPITDDITQMNFIPSSPTLMNGGTSTRVGTLSSCFPMQLEDSIDGIFESLKEHAIVTKYGGGVGTDFSVLRSSMEDISSLGALSSGPLAFIENFNTMLDSIRQGGRRRGAGMAMLSLEHPDIISFITVKNNLSKLNRLNLSVRIPSSFYEKLSKQPDSPHQVKDKLGNYFDLTDATGKPITVKEVWDIIINQAWKCGEPGIFNETIAFDRCTVTNLNKIVCANPCQEFIGIPYQSCNLGSINLCSLVDNKKFDWARYDTLIVKATRFIDAAIDVNKFPLKKIKDITLKTRPLGIGVMGLAHMLFKKEIPYNSDKAIKLTEELIRYLTLRSMQESIELAKENGAYEAFDYDLFMKANERFFSKACRDLDVDKIAQGVKKYGVRNNSFTSIAPTGTIAYLANVSGGIEPVFALSYTRRIEVDNYKYESVYVSDPIFDEYLTATFDQDKKNKILKEVVENKGSCQNCKDIPKKMREIFVVAEDIKPMEHLDILEAVANNVSLSASKCIAKGTLVQTNKGILPIESLGSARGDDIFSDSLSDLKVRDLSGNWQKVLRHYSGGCRQTKIITLSNGNKIECSNVHKFYIYNGWVDAKDLIIGQKLFCRSSDFSVEREGGLPINTVFDIRTNANLITLPNRMTESLALFLGMMVSDGSMVESTGCVCVTTADDSVEKLFKRLVKELFGVLNVYVTYDKRTKSTRSVFVTSRQLVRYLIGLISNGCVNKKVPIQILQGSKQEQIQFINGITLDGYINRKGLTLYEGYSKILVDQVFSICCNLGLKPTKRKKYVKTGRLSKYSYSVYIFENLFSPIEKHKQIPLLDGTYIIPVPEEIKNMGWPSTKDACYGSYKTVRTNKYMTMRTDNMLLEKANWDKGLYLLEITNIEDNENEVYDIEVENTHSYLIDNVISHNTVNLSKDATPEDVAEVFINAHKRGIIGVTVYREGSRDGILLHSSNGNGNGIVERPAPLRPVDLPCDVHRITVQGEKWIVFIGLLKNKPYEIFAGKVDEVNLQKNIKNGIISKVKSSQYAFKYDDEILVKNICKTFDNETQEALTRMISTALQNGTMITRIMNQLGKSKGTIVDFSKAIMQALKHYIDDGEQVGKCPTCSNKLIYMEGCIKCSNPECGYSKCG